MLLLGYNYNESKFGYKQTTLCALEDMQFCEVKPKNISSFEIEKYKHGKREKSALLNAGGNFTDYTCDRFDKNFKDNPNLLVSGFVDGRLVYISVYIRVPI